MTIMFHLMNEARIAVGVQGLASASAAYLNALSYTKERVQGGAGSKAVTIVQHPDVRRMLMDMKSSTEARGSRRREIGRISISSEYPLLTSTTS